MSQVTNESKLQVYVPRKFPSIFLFIFPVLSGVIALLLLSDQTLPQLIEEISHLGPVTWNGVGASLFCGGILGWERQLRNKPIGIRTSMLVTLGTYLFVAVSIHTAQTIDIGTEASVITDPSRIIGQIVSGIGFLGAGVMFTRKGSVTGVTSAATIWLLASVGVCVGVGAIETAIKIATLGAVILIVVDAFDDVIADFFKVFFHHKSRYNGELLKKAKQIRKSKLEE